MTTYFLGTIKLEELEENYYDYENHHEIDLQMSENYWNSLWYGHRNYLNSELDWEKEKYLLDIPEQEVEYEVLKEEEDIVVRQDSYRCVTKQLSRSGKLSNELKVLYNYTCQLCQSKIKKGIDTYATETHHIKPRSEQGPDIKSNMMVLCPTCHTLFDNGANTIDVAKKRVIHFDPTQYIHNSMILLKHTIDLKYLNHHNKSIFLGSTN